jgi:phosphopantothenoylcysteine decarboxylase/phosphopantothenate--cysteine ligase
VDAGARVTLIRGPVSLPDPKGAEVVRVQTALQMLEAARAALPADVFVAAAAVADWRVEKARDQKLKKGPQGAPTLSLVENPDILAEIAKPGTARPAFVIGFAAETENVLENARGKLTRKGCDIIVANCVAEGTGVFGGADNEVQIVSPSGTEAWRRMTKAEIAKKLIGLIALRFGVRT